MKDKDNLIKDSAAANLTEEDAPKSAVDEDTTTAQRSLKKGRGTHQENPSSVYELQIPFLHEDGVMMESERQIADYLQRCGLVAEPGINSEDKARALKKRREENYHNVVSLLNRYRTLRRTHAIFLREFSDSVAAETRTPKAGQEGIFNYLSQQLDVLSVTEERRFQATYAPQITAGRKIEVALAAVNFGLGVLADEDDKSLYKLIKIVYIDGETKPSVREAMEKMNCTSHSSYYRKLDAATKRLTKTIFGFTSNKAELMSILVYLRQQIDDDYFPDCY